MTLQSTSIALSCPKLYRGKFLQLFFLSLILFSTSSFAQDKYWQQEVNYTIEVELNDRMHELDGEISIEYINNSPEYLNEIYMHLWPNAYMNKNTALAKQLTEEGDLKLYYSKPETRGFIDKLKFEVDGEKVTWELDKNHPDICRIKLNESIRPGNKIVITTPFRVKIPGGNYSRLGHLDQAYQITQWYPKPAVYDKNGWNQMPYLNQGEFYSEFGSYDVSITVPQNYVVGATGDLVDGEEELKWLNEKAEATIQKETFDTDMSFPPSAKEKKTLRYKQSNVHDFAWFADKRWNVLKGEVTLPNSGKKVTTWSMFLNQEAHLWKNSIEYINDAVFYYSKWIGDYPYNHVTAVDGALSAGSGMEYPNITIIGTSGSAQQLETVIMHEVGHNWFYGIFGTNERIHPWMDEGINSYYEARYVKTKYPKATLANYFGEGAIEAIASKFEVDKYPIGHLNTLGYLVPARKNVDQPIEYPAHQYTQINYFGVVYSKTPLALEYLAAYLGQEEFDRVMHKYYDEWKFKHPQPEDFRKLFESETKENLDWFFDELIPTTKRVDYKVTGVSNQGDSMLVNLKNVGKVSGPFPVSLVKDDSTLQTYWLEGFDKKSTVLVPKGEYNRIVIDRHADLPEFNRKNNSIRTSGIFKRVEPLSFRFLGRLEREQRTQVFWLPTVGWNNYNKTMIGVAFYNNLIPSTRVDYIFNPMFATGHPDLAGHVNMGYSIIPTGSFVEKLRIGVSGSRYGYTNSHGGLNYHVIKPEILLNIRKTTERSTLRQAFRYRYIMAFKESRTYDYNVDGLVEENTNYYVNDFTQYWINDRTINPYSITVNVQQGSGFLKGSIEAMQEITYKGRNKGLQIRLFAGNFFVKDNTGRYRFRMSGQRGYQDYLYDEVYLGRNETSGFMSQQFTETDGNFKAYTPVGQSSDWLVALNLKSSIVKWLPLNVFADVGTYTDATNAFSGSQAVVFDAGLSIPIIANVCEVYFPLVASSDIRESIKVNTPKYYQQIRFTLNFSQLNAIQRLRNFDF